ncbi:oligopeptide/dipeptide ABC transporter ATP-binding protein [Streptosporangium sp. NPDC004379]|uniref:oligopeptide/dipeptide ABC transporter ATP-binding protein n=1 Tax=Streptosporangium sp. NPDC004379 TaxID=3366189 RepID=UPI003677C2D8
MTSPLLQVEGLTRHFTIGRGRRARVLRAVHDVSFEVGAGEIVTLVGESGSGKSTTARLVARLDRPTGGTIRLDGTDVLTGEPRRASPAYRRAVQMVFQDPFGSLNPVHTVGHHLRRPLILHGHDPGDVAGLLTTVGLDPSLAGRHPHELSGGQRQRVAIARALAVRPRLIVADEPVSMLDVSVRAGVLNLMERLRATRGTAYLYITHDLASARYLGGRILVMYAGHAVEGADAATLVERPAHPYTRLLLSAVPDPRREHRGAEPPAAPAGAAAAPAPTGCPFTARCPLATARCAAERPARTDLGGGHWVRCHAAEEGRTR